MGHQNRRMWRFWLALDKPEDEILNCFCEWASEQRKLAQFIRDGLRLVGTLREGRIDVLIEMFPFVQEALITNTKRPDDGGSSGTDRRLDRIEQLLLENSQGTAYQMGGFKPTALKKIGSSNFDDDLDTLVLEKSTAAADLVATNYLKSLGALSGEDYL